MRRTTQMDEMQLRSHKRRRNKLIRSGISMFLMLALSGSCIYSTIQLDKLKDINADLVYQNAVLTQDLEDANKQLVEAQTYALKQQQLKLEASRGGTRRAVQLTAEEFELVCRVVIAESRGQSSYGQKLVAQCIRDRLLSNCYGADVTRVVTAPAQFAKPWQGDLDDWPAAIHAVYDVFTVGNNAVEADVRVFFNPETAAASSVKMLRDKYELILIEGSHEFRGIINE